MSQLYFLMPLLAAFLIPGVPVRAQDQEGKEIEDMLHAYYTTMSERDWEAYRAYFIDSAILVTIWQPAGQDEETLFHSTIDAFIRKTPQGPDSQPVFEEKMTRSQIEVHGRLAVAWADYEAKFGTQENLTEWVGKDLFTLIKIQNTWKIVSLTYMSD